VAWRLLVYNPDGSHRATLTPDTAAVDRIAWSVRGDGDCQEAVIIGRGLDLRARDIVAIQASPTPDGGEEDLQAVYWGWVVSVGDPEDPELTEWRLIGGSQRLREVINRQPIIIGSDVASMAVAAAFPQLPTGVRYDAARFATQGFALGKRAPRFESVGDTLDALAAAVPGFDVEPGTTYTYDGRTYRHGDRVPETTWGVRAGLEGGVPNPPGGWLFFERVDDVDASGNGAYARGPVLHERRDGLTLRWEPVAADVVVDSVVVFVTDQPSNGLVEIPSTDAFGVPGPIGGPYGPIAYVLQGALDKPYNSWKLVEAPTFDVFKHVAFSGTGSFGFTNPGNATDSDPTTYASSGPSAGAYLEATLTGSAYSSLTYKPRATLIRYSSLRAGFRLRIAGIGFDFGLDRQWELQLGNTEGEQREVIVVHPWDATSPDPAGGIRWRVEYAGEDTPDTDDLRVYDLKAFAPDAAVLDRIARSHLRPPPERVASIEVPGRLLRPGARVRLTLDDGELLELPVAALELSITRELGFSTLIRVGQELPAPLQAEKDLLARRIEKAVAPGRRS